MLILPNIFVFYAVRIIWSPGFPRKNDQNDVTQVKLFIMTVKSLLEVQNTNNIILSDFQQ